MNFRKCYICTPAKIWTVHETNFADRFFSMLVYHFEIFSPCFRYISINVNKSDLFKKFVLVLGGDFQNANGTGGESIYGAKFDDEGFSVKHDVPGLLSKSILHSTQTTLTAYIALHFFLIYGFLPCFSQFLLLVTIKLFCTDLKIKTKTI